MEPKGECLKKYWPFCVVPVGNKWAVFNLENCVYENLDAAELYPSEEQARLNLEVRHEARR
jgi:hypothetical protein